MQQKSIILKKKKNMKKNECTTSDYIVSITKARGKSTEKYSYRVEIRIMEIMHNYFDHNTVMKITNTIFSMLYPGLSFQNHGSITRIQIEVRNGSLCKKNNGILSGYIRRIDCRYTEEKCILHLNIEIELFTKEGSVATSHIQVHPKRE
jgi:hypothetical protein